MEHFGSECSSACESGWTFYLGHSTFPCDSYQKYKNSDEDPDDNMSLVSDASSGPPHVQQQEQEQEQEQECNNHNNGVFNGWKTEKVVIKEGRKIQDLTCFLDETASSSFFNSSDVETNQDSLEESNNIIADYSKEHFQGESKFQDQFGGFKSSVSGIQLQQNQW